MKAKTKILYEDKILDSISAFLLFMLFVFLSFRLQGFFKEDINNEIVDVIILFVFFSVLYTSKKVCIKDGVLVKGVYFLYFMFNTKRLPISEIKEVVISQNDENYFEIVAIANDSSRFEIKKLPNKNPALKELDLIKAHLNIS